MVLVQKMLLSTLQPDMVLDSMLRIGLYIALHNVDIPTNHCFTQHMISGASKGTILGLLRNIANFNIPVLIFTRDSANLL